MVECRAFCSHPLSKQEKVTTTESDPKNMNKRALQISSNGYLWLEGCVCVRPLGPLHSDHTRRNLHHSALWSKLAECSPTTFVPDLGQIRASSDKESAAGCWRTQGPLMRSRWQTASSPHRQTLLCGQCHRFPLSHCVAHRTQRWPVCASVTDIHCVAGWVSHKAWIGLIAVSYSLAPLPGYLVYAVMCGPERFRICHDFPLWY